MFMLKGKKKKRMQKPTVVNNWSGSKKVTNCPKTRMHFGFRTTLMKCLYPLQMLTSVLRKWICLDLCIRDCSACLDSMPQMLTELVFNPEKKEKKSSKEMPKATALLPTFSVPEELSSASESGISPLSNCSSSWESETSTGLSPLLLAWKALPPWRKSSFTIWRFGKTWQRQCTEVNQMIRKFTITTNSCNRYLATLRV